MENQKSFTSDLPKIVGENVKARRLRLGFSQEELADICGYHRTYIGSIERAERNITICTLESIATALGTSPQELLKGNNG